MAINISTEINDTATPVLNKLAKLAASDRTWLNQTIGIRIAELTRGYLQRLNRHATANRLGANPTNYFERKAESVEFAATADDASVIIAGHEAFARVLGPVTIRPRSGHKYLTIPASSASYGRRARELANLRFIRFGKTGKAALATTTGKGKDRKLNIHYWLKESVHQSMDRTLLPSDDAYLQAAEQGANDYLDVIIADTANPIP